MLRVLRAIDVPCARICTNAISGVVRRAAPAYAPASRALSSAFTFTAENFRDPKLPSGLDVVDVPTVVATDETLAEVGCSRTGMLAAAAHCCGRACNSYGPIARHQGLVAKLRRGLGGRAPGAGGKASERVLGGT